MWERLLGIDRLVPVLAGVTRNADRRLDVAAFSEQAAGTPEQTEESDAEEQAAEPARGTILGQPLMNFVMDMAAGLGAILLLIAWLTPSWSHGAMGLRLPHVWQGFLFFLVVGFLVTGSITFMRTKNWGLLYVALGVYHFVFMIIHLICGGGVNVGWTLSVVGCALLIVSGVMLWLVFVSDELEKPWPVGLKPKQPAQL